ncbi:GntR family transcriptional regulator [Methylobacterium sp. Leaf104]|uniref:aminotransferase-like domain-containing protein n=1 Tax=Methylobacterium TaxID=407 RepID=UPI0006F22A3F|nr:MULTISPECIES: PLP-dependent aminotransferase family protein [Methylobacterium]KQP33754.1 GntR family transcriptional regulator [Methylobacterium sp. Leaf104]MCI9879684.1 PLP-dependent aminotransferase family protein [Methylobacterium goesingense]
MKASSLSASTLVKTVAAAITERIASRQLMPGARLPSVRAFAAAMGVSKSTVVDAYDRLGAEGAIVARRGSGFYVSGKTRPLCLKTVGPQLDRAVDPLWITRQSMQAGPDLVMPGSGWLPPSWMPDDAIRRGLRQLARGSETNLVSHDQPLGFPPLRAQIARRLAERGVEAGADQVVLIDSATQALDLLCRFLLEPGDTVLVDDPCYFNYHGLLRAQRARIVGVPMTPNGPDLNALATLLAEHRPRFYVINSALQNPTGSTLAPAIAHRILKLAEVHDTLIIEDDIFGDFEGEPSPRLAGFDGLERVIQIGSFSKTLSAAVRCGYIALREDWMEPLIDLKLAMSLGNSHLSASLMHGLLTDGTYRRHLSEVREKLGRAMAPALRRLEGCGLSAWLEPSGGFFLWMRLPVGADSADVARHALARGLVLAPGGAFSPSSLGNNYLRFNVAQCADPRMIPMLEASLDECAAATSTQAA